MKTFSLDDGMNKTQFRVPHQTKSLPPAIVYSTKPAGLDCAVAGYRYGARATRGRMKISVRCQDTPRNARAKLVFRAPYVRQLPLRNGTSDIRIRADKPRGASRPLGSLTTIPRDTNCDVTPTGTKIRPRQFSATAKLSCKDLPAGAKGIFGLGGLVSAGQLDKAGRPTAAVTSSYQGATTSGLGDFAGKFTAGDYRPNKCDDEKTLDIKGGIFRWKNCYSAPFKLEPWESQWVGLGTPSGQCESGWKRSFGFNEAPAAWLFSKFNVTMWTEPDTPWYSWTFGTVTNWQINESVEFRFQWYCYKIG